MSSYAQVNDLFVHGAPMTAFQQGANPIPNATLQSALDDASDLADSYIGPRGQLPLLEPYPGDLVKAVCKIAAFEILSTRGINPASGADTALEIRYNQAMKWLDNVRTQVISPAFLFSPDPTQTHQQPYVQSSSVINLATGGRAANRGW
jgi:phage gp36-like protein